MALFAGDNYIMTGEELTYDYNFDPFSAKNVQQCRCGSENCRGVLGPRPKDLKLVKESIKEAVKASMSAGKRKLKELLGDDEEKIGDSRSPKKRKIKEAMGVKRSASSASMRVAKGAAKALKKSVSAQLLNAKNAISSRGGGYVVVKKVLKTSTLKTYGKGQNKPSSRKSSLTAVAADDSPRTGKEKALSLGKPSAGNNVVKSMRGGSVKGARRSNGGTIRVISVAGGE